MSKQLLFTLLLPFTIALYAMDSTIEQIEPSIDEKTAQQAIRSLALQEKISDTQAIWQLQSNDPIWTIIFQKITTLFYIVSHGSANFSKENLADEWYINSTTGPHQTTLLYSALEHDNPKKMRSLYAAGFKTPHDQYEKALIQYVARNDSWYNLKCIRVLLEYSPSPEILTKNTFYPTTINDLIDEVSRYKHLKESNKVMELVEDVHDILFLFIDHMDMNSMKHDLQALSCTNKKWNEFLTNKNNRKKIIDTIALKTEWNDTYIASRLGFMDIYHQIKNPFSTHNLITPIQYDTWFLNATTDHIIRNSPWGYHVNPPERPCHRTTFLLNAIEYRDIKDIAQLLESGANPNNPKVENPLTHLIPVYSFAKQGSYNMIKLLLEKGAQPDTRISANKYTPLAYAVAHNHKGLARLLLRFGANPNVFWFEKEPKGWFTKMVNEVKENPNAKPIKKQSTKNNKDAICSKK